MENNKRLYREQTPETKQKISNSMKQYFANRSTEEARSTASKHSEAMKRYWSRIPSKSEYQGLTMDEYLRGNTLSNERKNG